MKSMETRLKLDAPKINKVVYTLRCASFPEKLHYLCDAFFSNEKRFAPIAGITHPLSPPLCLVCGLKNTL